MTFYTDLKARYAPEMTEAEFSELMNAFEAALFDMHPEYLKLPEAEQNRLVEEHLRKTYARHH